MTTYQQRHIGLSDSDIADMLASLGQASLEEFMSNAIPPTVRSDEPLDIPAALTEAGVAESLRTYAQRNDVRIPMIGMGYYRSHLPAVIRRNVLENPGWYTAYTPYQPEISQGRLEVLLVFQHMVADLTGLPIANASLLDEPTAAAEAMALAHRVSKSDSHVYLVDGNTHPQTIAVLRTRAVPLGIDVQITDVQEAPTDCFGALVSYPGSDGAVRSLDGFIDAVHSRGGLVAAACDLLALTLLRSPGEFGADIAVGSAQRFGVPLGFGGPHAGFMSVRAGLERNLPGRLVGVSNDSDGRSAYRLALQTREQHIRRERATSNICTSQVLLAVVSALYAAYHGPTGLREIASEVARKAVALAGALAEIGAESTNQSYFGTVTVQHAGTAQIVKALAHAGVDVRQIDSEIFSVAVDETTQWHTISEIVAVAAEATAHIAPNVTASADGPLGIDPQSLRTTEFLSHPWFNQYQSETEMMRWLRRLADRDLALDRSMIPLGSCTMKLNAAAAMEPISWPGFADIHPFSPIGATAGYRDLIDTLASWLAEITGYAKVSVQPNAGSQGEFAGLLAIRSYLSARGEGHRVICLIPASAHGTNAASAAMAGMQVVVVACDETGGVDLADLREKVTVHGQDLAAVMLTYPSTYGVYEDTIREVCDLVHAAGGQVYVDGANLNALVGWARFAEIGADVSHLNLHKTFCIPHGGGGPGVGPIGVRAHLVEHLPETDNSEAALRETTSRVNGAAYGSAGILPIPFAYIAMMGPEGLRSATAAAVLAANYVAHRLSAHYPALYTGANGLVAHECILDIRAITQETGVTVDDIAKRLIDYGFHAPTMSFPVAGTLMVEPTESESKRELDRFCDAMVAIRAEIDEIASGAVDVADSALRNAPHTAEQLTEDWERQYSRESAVYPARTAARDKYWPPVSRIDGAYGDRNLMCSCPPVAAYQ